MQLLIRLGIEIEVAVVGRNKWSQKFIRMGGNMKNDKLWLLIDSTHKKLLRARLWTTSLNDYKQDIEDAIRALEQAKKKIEEEK